MTNVYNLLKHDLYTEFDIELTEKQVDQVVEFFERKGLLDYDTVKEVYLNDE